VRSPYLVFSVHKRHSATLHDTCPFRRKSGQADDCRSSWLPKILRCEV